VYGEETSTNEFVGYLFALLGFVLYNLAKMNVFGPAAPAVAVGDRRSEASSGGSGSDSSSGEGGKYGSGGGGATEGGEEGSTAGSSSSGSGGSSSCCSRWLSIFQLQDLETQVYDRERAAAEMRRSAGIYPGFNLSSYAPSSGSAYSATSLSGASAGAGAGSGSSSGVSMARLANLTAGKQRNLQSFSKDSDCEEAAADASETSRLLAGGGSGSGGGGSGSGGGGSSGSSSSSRSGVTGVGGSSGDTNNRKKKG
jgi:hypothetical protein